MKAHGAGLCGCIPTLTRNTLCASYASLLCPQMVGDEPPQPLMRPAMTTTETTILYADLDVLCHGALPVFGRHVGRQGAAEGGGW